MSGFACPDMRCPDQTIANHSITSHHVTYHNRFQNTFTSALAHYGAREPTVGAHYSRWSLMVLTAILKGVRSKSRPWNRKYESLKYRRDHLQYRLTVSGICAAPGGAERACQRRERHKVSNPANICIYIYTHTCTHIYT